MKFFSDDKKIEVLIIVVFLICMLFVKTGQNWAYRINHDYPVSFRANDNFFNSMVPEEIKESGSYHYLPKYAAAGYEDVVAYVPPFLYHLSAMFSFLSSVETYNCTHLIAIFLFSMGCVLFYFIIKKTNKELALLSLPFMIGIFGFPFEIAYQWGLWMFMSGFFFLIGVIWSLTKMGEKYGFILLGIFLAGTAIAHFSELMFAIGFILFYYLFLFLTGKKITKLEIKNLLLGFLIFLVLSSYYILIAYFTYLKIQTLVFNNVDFPIFAPNYGVNFGNFGINQFLIFFGIILFIGTIFYKKDMESVLPKMKMPSLPLLFSVFMLLVGFTNYIGFNRAFQTRIAWPVYLSVLMALTIYFAIGFLKKWRYPLVVSISFILILVFSQTYIGMIGPGGIITKGVWDGFVWLGENTETNSNVMHFYSPTVTQDLSLFSSKRIPYKIDLEEYKNALENRVINSDYAAHLVHLTDMRLPYRKSLFSYGYHVGEEDYEKIRILSMWDMDYYFLLVNSADPNDVLVLYNRAVGEFLINQTWIDPVYSNNEIVILKNNEPERRP